MQVTHYMCAQDMGRVTPTLVFFLMCVFVCFCNIVLGLDYFFFFKPIKDYVVHL